MRRDKRTIKAASSIYPPTPDSGRDHRASSIFPYSVERPPTGFEHPGSNPPAMSAVSPTTEPHRNPFTDEEEEEPIDTRETPMYARSDWGATTGMQTAFEQKEFPNKLAVPRAHGNEEEGEEEEVIDTRETPIYARSDWGTATGVQTAFDKVGFPPSLAVPLQPQQNISARDEAGRPKTIWSRSSYHSQAQEGVGPGLGDDDVYTGQAPETAWTRSSQQARQPPPLTNTPLPPTPSRPPRSPARPKVAQKSRHSVKNHSYGSALKRAGSKKASQLVDITELSEDSHSRSSIYSSATATTHVGTRVASIFPCDQADNPFSPVFAAAAQGEQGYVPITAPSSGHKRQHRSTLPSILDLEHLGARSGQAKNPRDRDHSHSAGPGQTLDPPTFPRQGPGTESPRLLTPEAQNRLGRMSVATARYSLPPARSNGNRSGTDTRSNPSRASSQNSSPSATSAMKHPTWWSRITDTGLARWYRTYRAFLVAGHAVMAALLMVIALADPASGLGFLAKVKEGGLASMPADRELGLSVSSWCPLGDKESCSNYATGNFASHDGSLKISSNPIIDLLYPLWTALASVLCLQALFTVSTAFLHFYLFYILHIPFNHLLGTPSRREDEHEQDQDRGTGQNERDDIVQREVDIRARCERPPFEEYIWLWWAWWAFRKGPVGHIYGFVTGGLAVICSELGYRFNSQLSGAASPGTVSIGMGAFIPLAVLMMVLDPFMSSVKYFIFTPRRSFNTFLQPPDPTPAAILLPQAEKPLARRRRATGMSTFYAPPTSARYTRGQTLFPSHLQGNQTGGLPPLPPTEAMEQDDETRRWLLEYPKDPELVPLITDLQAGGHNDDFLLSDVGLLYLRPDEQDANGAALLVPPNGVIRAEVLEDAHIGDDGEHKAFLGMLSQLGEVFWWVGMEQDIERHIARCGVCAGNTDNGKYQGAGAEDGRSMYTGVTGWTGVDEKERREEAMAADMAIAMRKAEEDAKRKWEA